MKQKKLIQVLGFKPKENTSGIFHKTYSKCDNYEIEIDFEKENFNFGDKIKAESKTTQNFSQAENWVVLECVNRLLEKGYQPQNITLEKTWATGHGTSGRLDILVTNDDGSAYLMIECKTWGTEFDKEFKNLEKNGGQLFTYFQQDKNAEIIMLYASELDGNEIKYRNEIVKIEEDYRQTGNVKDLYERWNKLPQSNGVFDNWVTPYEFQSKALTPADLKDITPEDSSKIFNQFLEILRHNVVSDKGNAFNKIFTLFLCKIYDEKFTPPNEELKFQWFEAKDNHISFQKRLTDLYKLGMDEFLDKEVTDLSDDDFENKYGILISDKDAKAKLLREFTKIRLEKNNEFAIKEVFDTPSFEENAKVVKEVVMLLQGYKIRYTKKQQYLSDFFELLLTTGLKQESGQFFTPVPIAQFIIKSIPLDAMVKEKLSIGKRNELLPTVIDYASGSGHFITESMHEIQKIILEVNAEEYIADTKDKLNAWKTNHFDWAYDYVYGIEKDYRLVKVGKVGCYLHGDGLAKVIHSDGLASFSRNNEYKSKLRNTNKDFPQDNNEFDIVVSNPPYSVSSFKNNARKYYADNDFTLYSRLTDQSSEIECLFIERTKQLLKPNGVAGIILPSSILSNTGIYSKTRELILQYFEIVGITELGSNTFMATGTNTVVLFLRRRDNYFIQNLEIKVERAFADVKDVTINGIEKPLQKYVSHVWDTISIDDYKTLLQKTPNEKVQQHDIYKEYTKKIKAKNEQELWNSILALEQNKLLYFIITYPQKLVLVKTGEKDAEKRFLGYEFSNRRGSEGIHPMQRSKSIDECTQLYDADSFSNPEKASAYIYKAFNGEFDLDIAENLTSNITYQNLVDMLTFDRVDFEKSISLNVKKKVKIESKWELIKLGDFENVEFINGYAFKSSDLKDLKTVDDEIEVLKIGNISISGNSTNFENCQYHSQTNYNSKIVNVGDLAIALTGATVGKAGWVSRKCLLNQRVLVIKSKANILKYISTFIFSKLFYEYSQIIAHGNAQGNLSPDQVKDFTIPLPPKDIQEKIVSEIESLNENMYKKIEYVANLKGEIFQLMDNVQDARVIKLENIASLIKRGKSAKYGNSGIQIIKSGQARGFKEFDFSKKHFVIENFVLDERKLEKGDILINSTGVGTAGRVTLFELEGIFVVDSHITIVRLNQELALPIFVLYSLIKIGFKNIEAMAEGQSGQIELSIKTIQNIKITLPSLHEQEKIVAEIEKIEKKIADLEKDIELIPKQKELILKKYLE